MTDWFEWNGVKCTDYGIHVSEHPPITKPKERTSDVSIPGRSGTLTILEGEDIFDDVSLSANCFIQNIDRINDINAWLRGTGTVRFANRQDGYYKARVANQIPFDKVLRGNPHRTFTVQFKCEPYFYLDGDFTKKLRVSGRKIENEYDFASRPLITINGTGNVSLTIGDTTISVEGLEDTITVDTESMLAYKYDASGNLVNECMKVTLDNEEWPDLPPGRTQISWTGSVDVVIIDPRWRCL